MKLFTNHNVEGSGRVFYAQKKDFLGERRDKLGTAELEQSSHTNNTGTDLPAICSEEEWNKHICQAVECFSNCRRKRIDECEKRPLLYLRPA